MGILETCDFDSLFKKWEGFNHEKSEQEEPIKQHDPSNCPCILRDLFTDKDIEFLTTTPKGKDIIRRII